MTGPNDNCPENFNPGQEDSSGTGIPDACSVLVSGFGLLLDSDAEGIADLGDNCIYVANVDQVDSNRNGIGDACTEQTATVELGTTIEMSFQPEPYVQDFNQVLFLTFDFHGDSALQCDWSVLNCTLQREEVEICIVQSFGAAGVTCDQLP